MPRIRIYTFGRFEIEIDGAPLRFTGKLPRKPLALLKTIIAFGGRNVREERLIDALWSAAHGDAARYSLTSAIHRLRRLLARPEVLIRKDGRLSLNQEICWVDIWEVERLLDRVEAIPVSRDGEKVFRNETIELVRHAGELYRGPFLDGDLDVPWSSALADQVRRRLLKQLAAAGEHWQANERWDEAVNCYEKSLTIDPCAEDICRRLMGIHYRLGRTSEILRTYDQCREALQTLAGLSPSPMTEALLQQCLNER